MLLGRVDVVCEESAIEGGAAYSENLRGFCPVPLSLLECSKYVRFRFCVMQFLGEGR